MTVRTQHGSFECRSAVKLYALVWWLRLLNLLQAVRAFGSQRTA